jgi:uncharacterized protein (TIGR02246 family)
MLKFAIHLFILMGPLVSSAFAQTEPANHLKTDEGKVRGVVTAFAEAWNAADMQKFSELFTEDADWVNIRGARWKGKQAIKGEHSAIHKRFYSKSRVEFADITVRWVAKDAAIVHAKETVTGSDVPKEAGINANSQMSLVIVRRSGKWLIANGQNTNIIPPPPPRQAN